MKKGKCLTSGCVKVHYTPLRLLTAVALCRALHRTHFVLSPPSSVPLLPLPGGVPGSPVVRRNWRFQAHPRPLDVPIGGFRDIHHGLVATLPHVQFGSPQLLGDVVQIPGRLAPGAIPVGYAGAGPEGGLVADAIVGFDVGVAEESEIFRGGRFGRRAVLLRAAGEVALFLVLKE